MIKKLNVVMAVLIVASFVLAACAPGGGAGGTIKVGLLAPLTGSVPTFGVSTQDGAQLAVVLPPGWRPNLPDDQPLPAGEQPGELWLWTPGQPPAQKLADQVDFGSPLAWLP